MLHRRTPTRIGLAVASAAALLLAGCSTQENADTSTETSVEAAATSSADSSPDTSAGSTVTSTATESTAPEESATAAPPQVTTTVIAQAPAEAEAGDDPAPAPDPGPQPTSEADPPPPAPAVPASTESIYGQPVTHCSSGNGYRVTDLWVGANTSCDFAFNTLGTLVESRNSGTDDLRLSMPASVRVYSPVTGGSYDMSCSMMDQRMIQCTGGDGAAVYLSMY